MTVRGFLDYMREDRHYKDAATRTQGADAWKEFVFELPEWMRKAQASRCMDCAIPFCHAKCPTNNEVHEWNGLVSRDQWKKALVKLHVTNNFPEFTGRICPAPCEDACTLNIDDNSVTIKTIECAIVDRGWAEGWIVPLIAQHKTDMRVAVVGSGPAGMACAQQLARAGHAVTLIEKNDRIGGLLRYGIPDFKMEKHHIDRRMEQMAAEGVEFRPSTEITDVRDLLSDFHAVAVTIGAEWARDLGVPGDDLSGIHYAMDFLPQQNKRNAGDDELRAAPGGTISAHGKHVVVIGGGDTGSDCLGTSTRQGAASVAQLEILPKPPPTDKKAWPGRPNKLTVSSSQAENGTRDWAVLTKRAKGENGKVTALECVRVDWTLSDGRWSMQEKPDSAFELKADLVLLAMGFNGPRRTGLIERSGLTLDPRGNILANTTDYKTSIEGVFAAGDGRGGQSIVVRAINEGRRGAKAVDRYVRGQLVM